MDANRSRQAVKGTEDESTLLAALPKRETNRLYQGKGVYKRGTPTCIHPEGGRGIAYRINRIDDIIAATIAAKEGRRVRCYDVSSTFVNTDVDEDVIMVLKGELADMMIQIAPEVYRKCVTADRKGMPILYVKLQKVLYGLMRASLLFY